jgi:hypothetical protein
MDDTEVFMSSFKAFAFLFVCKPENQPLFLEMINSNKQLTLSNLNPNQKTAILQQRLSNRPVYYSSIIPIILVRVVR